MKILGPNIAPSLDKIPLAVLKNINPELSPILVKFIELLLEE